MFHRLQEAEGDTTMAPTRVWITYSQQDSDTNLPSRGILASECYGIQFWTFTGDCLDLRVPLAELGLKKVNGTPKNMNSDKVKPGYTVQ